MATFVYPTNTKRVTSDFRTSHRPDHNGTDFADPGYHEIIAAAAGKIRRSYTSTSYGECIMIEHSINGEKWETVYAHMRAGSRRVNEGNKVKQGQVIGTMGNTGNSTGQHLHFELHKGGLWNMEKSNAVNPLDYLGKDLTPENKNYLSIGDSGKAVTKMQQDLASVYFYPEKGAKNNGVDGDFGPKTKNAVVRFQKMHGLKQDGKYGPKTKAKLAEVMKSKKPSIAGKRVEAIVAKVNFYDSPRWNNPSGTFSKGEGWTVIEEITTKGSPQLKVKNSKGNVYYITARKDLVEFK